MAVSKVASVSTKQTAAVLLACATLIILRFAIGPFALQGLLFVFVVAVAATRGPTLAVLAALAGFVAVHVQLFIQTPSLLTAPWRALNRQYITGFAIYLILCAVLVVVSRRHYRILDALERERVEKERLEGELLAKLSTELRHARERAAIVDSSDDAIISRDLDGHVTSWNRAAERMFGYPAEAMIGRSIRTIIPADRSTEEDAALASIGRGEKVDHFETMRLRNDGVLVPVSLTTSPLRDEHGTIVGASMISRDITERKQAEAALVDLQQRLLTLVGASGSLLKSPRVDDVIRATLKVAHELVEADGYALWRFDRIAQAWVTRASEGISETFARQALPAAGTSGTPAVPFTKPLAIEDIEQSPGIAQRRESYRAEGVQSMLVVPLIVSGEATGTLVFYYRTRHRFSEVEIQAGRALGNLAATALTTAELYDAQQQHRRESEFLAEVTSVLGRSLDYEKTLKQVAELAVPHVADWCAVDLVGEGGEVERLAVAHVDPIKVEMALKFRERFPEDPNSPYTTAYVVKTGNSAMIPQVTDEMLVQGARSADHLAAVRALGITSFMVVPLVVGTRILGAMTFVAAESGRRFTPDDLRFAEGVASRAALAVDNARAYSEARGANQLKDQFLATLSHELRTPLNAIVGYARMLRAGVFDPERQARGLEVLERNATSLTQIVDDLLDVSRIIAGKVRLNVQPVDLAAIIRQGIAAVRPAADAKQVRLEAKFDEDVPIVSGDPDRLQQVMWNLLTNAVKFTPHDGSVTVTLTRRDGNVEVAVADTGQGIAADFLPHIFERFRQADSRFSREHGGLGLGLAIARDLVELHGGTIQAISEGPGKGATLRISLPALIARPAPPPERLIPAGQVPGPSSRLNGVHVLVVDDEPDALTMMREILEMAGAKVTAAPSADGAFAVLERVVPQAVIADIGMPGTDGIEFIKRLRRWPERALRELPAIALTAYARTEDRAAALDAGFSRHLAKPIDPRQLVELVASLARRGDLIREI